MKKIYLLMLAALTLLAPACTNTEAPEMPKDENAAVGSGKVRSAEEAVGIALKAKGKFTGNESRSSFSVKSIDCFGMPTSRSGEGVDSLFYIVNFADNQGYAIVGADRRVDDVLAVIDEGNFDATDIEPKSPRALMYDVIQNYAIAQIEEPQISITPSDNIQYLEMYCDTINKESERMLLTQWKETGIYAKYSTSLYDTYVPSSKRKIGCGPLAMGTVMSYFQYPKNMTITFDGTNRDLSPNWKAMSGYDLGGGLSNFWADGEEEVAKEHIALVLREIAEKAEAIGESDGDVIIKESQIPIVMNYFGYNCQQLNGINNNHKLTALPSIKDRRMIICCGSRFQIDIVINIGGDITQEPYEHVFVFDGYKNILIRKGERVYEIIGSTKKLISDTLQEETEKSYVHINWGWGGTDNGYYNIEMFMIDEDRIADRFASSTDEPYTMWDFRFYSVSR